MPCDWYLTASCSEECVTAISQSPAAWLRRWAVKRVRCFAPQCNAVSYCRETSLQHIKISLCFLSFPVCAVSAEGWRMSVWYLENEERNSAVFCDLIIQRHITVGWLKEQELCSSKCWCMSVPVSIFQMCKHCFFMAEWNKSFISFKMQSCCMIWWCKNGTVLCS